jgi:hypothetical protein
LNSREHREARRRCFFFLKTEFNGRTEFPALKPL